MASALTVLLLGCWLAGHSEAWGEVYYPKPSISVSPGGVIPVGGTVTIRCWHQHGGLRFLLYKAGNESYLNYTDPAGSEAEFPITSARRDHGGSYTCRYSDRTGPAAYSEPSDPVQIIVAGGPDPTQPGAAPAPTRPGSTTGPDGSQTLTTTPPGLTRPIIAGVSAAATGLLLLLLLLVAFVCYRRAHARKGAAPRSSSTIPLGVLKAPAQQDPIDASVDEGKEPQTPEPDPEGLTYAELDGRALQTKRGGPAPAPEPALYATVNVSRGAPQ